MFHGSKNQRAFGRGRLGRAQRRAFVAVVALVAGMNVSAPAHAAASPVTAAFFDSEAGDWVGAGATYQFTTVTELPGSGGITRFALSNAAGDSFEADFAPPASQTLAPGVYENAERASFRSPGHAGLDVFGNGRGCNTVAGRFVVDEAVFSPTGAVVSFSAARP